MLRSRHVRPPRQGQPSVSGGAPPGRRRGSPRVTATTMRRFDLVAQPSWPRSRTLLRARMNSDIGSIPDVGAHLLLAGGKRLRPVLAALAARATGSADRHRPGGGRGRRADPHRDPVPRRRGRRRPGPARPPRRPAGVRQRHRGPGGRLLPGAGPGDRDRHRVAAGGAVAGRHRHRDGRGRGGPAGTGGQPRRHHRAVLRRHRSQDRLADRLVRPGGRSHRRGHAGCDAALGRYGRAVGRAFQIADDILDCAGDRIGHRQVGRPRPAGGQADPAGAAGLRSRSERAGTDPPGAGGTRHDRRRPPSEVLALVRGRGRGGAARAQALALVETAVGRAGGAARLALPGRPAARWRCCPSSACPDGQGRLRCFAGRVGRPGGRAGHVRPDRRALRRRQPGDVRGHGRVVAAPGDERPAAGPAGQPAPAGPGRGHAGRGAGDRAPPARGAGGGRRFRPGDAEGGHAQAGQPVATAPPGASPPTPPTATTCPTPAGRSTGRSPASACATCTTCRGRWSSCAGWCGRAGPIVILEFFRPASPQRWSRLFFDRFYNARVLPLLGWAVTGDKAAYQYLPASIARFLSRSEFEQALRMAGFAQVRGEDLFPGRAWPRWWWGDEAGGGRRRRLGIDLRPAAAGHAGRRRPASAARSAGRAGVLEVGRRGLAARAGQGPRLSVSAATP